MSYLLPENNKKAKIGGMSSPQREPTPTRTKKKKMDIDAEIELLKAIERRLSMLKMNGKTGFLYEMRVIIDKLEVKNK